MDSAAMKAEAEGLVFAGFDEAAAWRLGETLVAMAQAETLPVVINIRTADRTLFHAALPGSAPLNDLWARRKSNTALAFHEPSMVVTLRHRADGDTFARHGLDPADYVASGGAVPIRVRGVGVVAVATVSGLPEAEDHALVVRALKAMLAG
jgi:uncharacterized protein (UPF0303 family)